ncbi:MAG: hypothetical protein HW396_1658, partial [Candidatus Dadabacteria bacterium]|nr:hypothetical protein [Candidatus Dadabacteria bacterium]
AEVVSGVSQVLYGTGLQGLFFVLVKHLESRLKARGFLRETPEWLKVRNTEEERLDGVSSTQRGSILWDPGYPRSPRSGRGGDQEGGVGREPRDLW